MNKEIRPKYGDITKISKELGCCHIQVTRVLRGQYNSDLAKRIRAKALELGGVEVPQK